MVSQMLCNSYVNSLYSSSLGNHTVLRSRECILEGSQLHWADRVFYDGKVYLTLDHTGTWRAHGPEALAFKAVWDREEPSTQTESTHLREGCINLMRELMLSEEPSGCCSFLLLTAHFVTYHLELEFVKSNDDMLPTKYVFETTPLLMLQYLCCGTDFNLNFL